MPYKVEITYFKPSGKYYSDGEYETQEEHLWLIFHEVAEMLAAGNRPGLVDGQNEFYAVVRVPTHPHDHPFLIVPGRLPNA